MEYMPEFEIVRPTSVAEAATLRAGNPSASFIAGGTDLVPNIRRGIAAPSQVIDLSGVAEIQSIEAAGAGLRIGAGVSLAALINDGRLDLTYPAAVQAAASIAANSHREVGTVGGNLCLDTRCVFYNQSEWWRSSNDYCLKSRGEICHVAPKGGHCFAAFSGDLAPALMIYGAQVQIGSPTGERTVPLGEMYRDDGLDHLALAADEMVVSVILPKPADGYRAAYAKSRVRGAIDFPLAGVAVGMRCDGEDIAELHIALTGTNSMPLSVSGTDGLVGQPLEQAALDHLLTLIPKQIQPMTSTFSPPGYRRRVVTNLVRSLVQRLYGG